MNFLGLETALGASSTIYRPIIAVQTAGVVNQFISQIIVSGAGTATSNGTYTRASGGTTTFTGPNGNTIGLEETYGGLFAFQIYDAVVADTTYTIVIDYITIASVDLAVGVAPVPTTTTSLISAGSPGLGFPVAINIGRATTNIWQGDGTYYIGHLSNVAVGQKRTFEKQGIFTTTSDVSVYNAYGDRSIYGEATFINGKHYISYVNYYANPAWMSYNIGHYLLIGLCTSVKHADVDNNMTEDFSGFGWVACSVWSDSSIGDGTAGAYVVATNPSTDYNNFPTTGWTPANPIITSVPTSIPVATTNTISVVDTFYANQTITLNKVSSTEYSTTAYPFAMGAIYCESTSTDVNINYNKISVIKIGDHWIYRYFGSYVCGTTINTNVDPTSVVEITNGEIPSNGWSPALSITAVEPPAGIPVASTNTIIVVDTSGYGWDGSYEKESSTIYRNGANSYEVISWNGSGWRLYDEDSSAQVFPVPPSTNINYIATTGWPAQTLAVPSGIPVASTNSISVNGFALSKQSSILFLGEVVIGYEDCGNDQTRDYGNKGRLEFSGGSWSYKYGPFSLCLETWDFTTYTNPSTNANLIPITGWSPSRTITAP